MMFPFLHIQMIAEHSSICIFWWQQRYFNMKIIIWTVEVQKLYPVLTQHRQILKSIWNFPSWRWVKECICTPFKFYKKRQKDILSAWSTDQPRNPFPSSCPFKRKIYICASHLSSSNTKNLVSLPGQWCWRDYLGAKMLLRCDFKEVQGCLC